MDGPLAGAELALGYLLGDEDFAAYAARTAAGITRARVSEPILPALVAALWRSRSGADQPALAVVGRRRRRRDGAGRVGGGVPAAGHGRLSAVARRRLGQRP